MIDRVYDFSPLETKGEVINTENVKGARPWRLKGELRERFPKDFSLIIMNDGTEIKVAQDFELLSLRMEVVGGVDVKSKEI